MKRILILTTVSAIGLAVSIANAETKTVDGNFYAKADAGYAVFAEPLTDNGADPVSLEGSAKD